MPRQRGLCARIDVVQVIQDRPYRVEQAVKIEAMKRHFAALSRIGVVRVQPIDELAHLTVAPHPHGETDECRPFGRWRLGMPDIVIDPCGVRPVALDGDKENPFRS